MMEQPKASHPAPGASAGQNARARAFAHAQRHSRRVRVLKFGLPVAALVLALVFGAMAYIRLPGGVSVDLANTSISDGKLVMANPKLGGFTRDNEPYSMTAARAIQDMSDHNLVRLEEITAELPFNMGNSALVDAGIGLLDRAANRLELTDGLTITTRDGMRAVLKSARIDIANSSMETDQPVEVTLDGVRLVADSMRAEADGRVMVFENKVRLNIEPGKFDTAFNAVGGNVAPQQ